MTDHKQDLPIQKRVAYCIGNFRYAGHTGFNPLNWVESDVKNMKQFLKNNDFQTTMVMNASKFAFTQIEKQIMNIAQNAQLKNTQAIIYFYYSGYMNLQKSQTCAVTTDNKYFELMSLVAKVIKFSNVQIIGFFDGCQFNVQDIRKTQQLLDCKGSYQVIHCQMPRIELPPIEQIEKQPNNNNIVQQQQQKNDQQPKQQNKNAQEEFEERLKNIKVVSATQNFLKFYEKSNQLEFKYFLCDWVSSQLNQLQTYAEMIYRTGTHSKDNFTINKYEAVENLSDLTKNQNSNLDSKPEEKIEGVHDLAMYFDEDVLERVIRYNEGSYEEQIEQINLLKSYINDSSQSQLLRDTCQCWLGWCHLFPLGDYEENEKEAVKIFEKYQHTPIGMFSLSMTYYHGYAELEKDYDQAFYFASKSAYQEDRRGVGLLGYMFHLGIAGDQNMMQAMNLYEKSADFGSANAMYNLGICYYNGDGVKQDKDKAITYYKMSADKKYQGAIDTLFDLGINYEEELKLKEEEEKKLQEQEEQSNLLNSQNTITSQNSSHRFSTEISEIPQINKKQQSNILQNNQSNMKKRPSNATNIINPRTNLSQSSVLNSGNRNNSNNKKQQNNVIQNNSSIFSQSNNKNTIKNNSAIINQKSSNISSATKKQVSSGKLMGSTSAKKK